MLVNIGKGIERDIDHTALPKAALEHAIYMGLRNILMDCHASATEKEYPDADERRAVADAMVDKKLDALMRGEVRVTSTREGDPVRAEAMKMAMAAVTAKIKAANRKPKEFEPAALRAAALKLVTPELMAQAKARVDQTKTIAGDLSDLGL